MSEFHLVIGDKIEVRLEPGDRDDWEDLKRIVDAYYNSIEDETGESHSTNNDNTEANQ